MSRLVLVDRFAEVLEQVLFLEPLVEVDEDRSPVLAGPGAYQARFDHQRLRIELNGHVLDRSESPDHAWDELVLHELFHAWVETCRPERFWESEGMTEEQAADAFARFALKAGRA